MEVNLCVVFFVYTRAMKLFFKKSFFACALALCLFSACQKPADDTLPPPVPEPEVPVVYVKYHIASGEHYSDQSTFMAVNYKEQKFLVKFDSSAIYQTVDPANQYDINKLYGFSDNGKQHHEFSARVGWRWSDGALRLFGYIYNNSVVSYQEIGAVSIGEQHTCSIKVSGSSYIFTVDGKSITMPRESAGDAAVGYKLYPYFGGDETAPHDMTISIKEL